MFTLILSLCASVFGPAWIVLGVLCGLLLDQTAIIWGWEWQLRRFLDEGKALWWFRDLGARIFFLRWWLAYLARQPEYAGMEHGLFQTHMIKNVMGIWGLVPSLSRVTRTIIADHIDSRVDGMAGLQWQGAVDLDSKDKDWLFAMVLEACCSRKGMEISALDELIPLGLALGMVPRTFKGLIMGAPLFPEQFAQHFGIPRVMPRDGRMAVHVRIDALAEQDARQDLHEYVDDQIALRDRLVDEYAEAHMDRIDPASPIEK